MEACERAAPFEREVLIGGRPAVEGGVVSGGAPGSASQAGVGSLVVVESSPVVSDAQPMPKPVTRGHFV